MTEAQRQAKLARHRAHYAANQAMMQERQRRNRQARPESVRRAYRSAYRAKMTAAQRQAQLEYNRAYRVTMTEAQKRAKRENDRSRSPEARLALYRSMPAVSLLKRARSRAKKTGRKCSISIADIVVPKYCPVFGVPLSSGRPIANSPSLDRIRNDEGYVPGNVIVVSARANAIKSDATWQELRALADFYERLERQQAHRARLPVHLITVLR